MGLDWIGEGEGEGEGKGRGCDGVCRNKSIYVCMLGERVYIDGGREPELVDGRKSPPRPAYRCIKKLKKR